jgi:hypothetical protein
MKYLIIVFIIFVGFKVANASNCNATKNGDWNDPTTWSCGHVPVNNDVITIGASYEVKLDVHTSTLSGVVINVYGSLKLEDGKKINLSADGLVNVYSSGNLTGGNGGSKIIIGGNTVYTGGTTKNGPFSLTTSGESVLPVKLTDLSASINSAAKVEIKWTTETELNNDFFTIEKSSNGLDYKAIGSVRGAGTTNNSHDYSFTDNHPYEGSAYYRLKQNDFDGKHEYFGPITIHYEKKENGGCVMKVYPNPCMGKCNVTLEDCNESEKDYIEVEMLDASGIKVHSHVPVREQNGNFNFEIDTHNYLKPGVYIVRGANKSEQYHKKIIVK